MTKTKYERNNELILRYQNGDDEAFTELYTANEGLIRDLMCKYNYIRAVDEDVKLSACHKGFINASKNYIPNDKTKFSSYCMKIMTRELYKEFNYLNQCGRKELIENSTSINTVVHGKENDTELINLLDAKIEDEYFEDQYTIASKAIQYAMGKSSAPFKQHIPSLLCEDYTQMEVATALGIRKQVVSYQVKKFKEYMKEYFDSIGVNSLEEALV